MRRAYGSLALLGLSAVLTACGDDQPDPAEPTNQAPVVRLISPTGGAGIVPGATIEIQWEATDPDGDAVTVDLSYYADFGQSGAIATNLPQTTTRFDWTTPGGQLTGLYVRIVAKDPAGLTSEDLSDGPSAIVAHSARGYVKSSVCQTCHLSSTTITAIAGTRGSCPRSWMGRRQRCRRSFPRSPALPSATPGTISPTSSVATGGRRGSWIETATSSPMATTR